MLRRFTIGLFVVSFTLSVIVAIRGEMSTAQPNDAKSPQTPAGPPEPGNSKPVKPANTLPIAQVVLFNSGKNQMVAHEVKEERTTTRKESLGDMSDERARALMGSPAIAAAVKENIRTGRALIKDLAFSEAALKELQTQLAAITDEQTRIRYNLEKLPANSDLQKRLRTDNCWKTRSTG